MIFLCAYSGIGKAINKWIRTARERLATIDEVWSWFAGSILESTSDDKGSAL